MIYINYRAQEKKKEGMTKLESFIYNEIKEENDENDNKYINYILYFRTLSESSHILAERKGAMLGYYSIVNVIKKISEEKGVEICHTKLLDELMKCIKMSLKDNDPKIILTGAQCMYNIMIYFNSYVLINFNDFFDGLLTLVTVEDPEIKDLAKNFDSSLKGIINYSFQGQLPKNFNLLEFFKKIILNISLENPANKSTIVSWISSINQIPGIKLINILYLFLGELFDMLHIKYSSIQDITNACLDDFYNEIENDFEEISYNIKIKIFEIVIQKCEKNSQEEKGVKIKAFKWANLFLKQYKILFMRMANNQKTKELRKKTIANSTNNTFLESSYINNVSSISNNINNAEDKDKEKNNKDKDKDNSKIKEKEDSDENNSFEDDDNKKFPFDLFTKILRIIFNNLKDGKDIKDVKKVEKNNKNNKNNNTNKNNSEDLYTIINNCNNCLLTIIEQYNMNINNIRQLEEVLMEYIYYENNDLLLTIIKWIEEFFNKFSEEAFNNDFNKFIQNFAFIATYKDQQIFETGIKTLCNIEKCRKGSLNNIILNFLNKFNEKDNNFSIKRASDFVIALCKELDVKHVYNTFAEVLSQIQKSNFNCKIINILNMHLLTSNNAKEIRDLLKNIQKTNNPEDKLFFEKLFKIWCINPVSCLILCLIAEDFELSFHLLNKFGNIKLNQENYFEYSQLIPVIESKEFISKKIKI